MPDGKHSAQRCRNRGGRSPIPQSTRNGLCHGHWLLPKLPSEPGGYGPMPQCPPSLAPVAQGPVVVDGETHPMPPSFGCSSRASAGRRGGLVCPAQMAPRQSVCPPWLAVPSSAPPAPPTLHPTCRAHALPSIPLARRASGIQAQAQHGISSEGLCHLF